MDENEIETLLERMTLEEKVSLLSGTDVWSVAGPERLGVGVLRVSDGPNGARGSGDLTAGTPTAAFPVGIALGASWDTALLHRVGAALAEECRDKGAQLLLGPTINLQRSVTNGRNFECFSEDPRLTAELAVAYVEGLQSGGVGATLKHFVGNESEIERTTMSSEIDERTLRELYLPPFEAAVRRADAWAVMTAYNRLNGTFCSEHPWLLGEVLRQDWGFDGLVMSDWFGSHSTVETIAAGLDLEMPGPTRDRGAKLVAAVREGAVGEALIDRSARRVLATMARAGVLADRSVREERGEDRAATRALIRETAAAGAVLLKNDAELLPLDPARCGTLAVIGPNAARARIMGGGSSRINAHYAVSPLEGIGAVLGEARLQHAVGCDNDLFVPLVHGEFTVDFFDGAALEGGPVATERTDALERVIGEDPTGGRLSGEDFSLRIEGDYLPERSGTHRVGLAVAGRGRVLVDGVEVCEAWESWRRGRTFFAQGCDEVIGTVELEAGRPCRVTVEIARRLATEMDLVAYRVGIALPTGDAELDEAVALAHAADAVVLCVGRHGEWDTEGDDLPDILLPGRQDELVERVAAANPRSVVVLQSGGPVAMPWLDAVPAVMQAWYGGQETGNAIADVLFGVREPGGRLPQSFPQRLGDNPTHTGEAITYPGENGRVEYREGRAIGYRHYRARGIEPLFPFGFGLGYTRFGIAAPRVDSRDDETIALSVELVNAGERAGSAVVQCYHDRAGTGDPWLELVAFARMRLEPGERRRVALAVATRALASFDPEHDGWRLPEPLGELHLGFSANDLRCRIDISGRATTSRQGA